MTKRKRGSRKENETIRSRILDLIDNEGVSSTPDSVKSNVKVTPVAWT